MVVRRTLLLLELDGDFWVEGFPACRLEPGAGREDESVATTRYPGWEPLAHPAFPAGFGRSDRRGGTASRLFQAHLEPGGRGSGAGVEHVRRDPNHGSRAPIRASSRRRVIFRCSSAATARSWSGSFPILDSRSARRSSALRPAAQTM